MENVARGSAIPKGTLASLLNLAGSLTSEVFGEAALCLAGNGAEWIQLGCRVEVASGAGSEALSAHCQIASSASVP